MKKLTFLMGLAVAVITTTSCNNDETNDALRQTTTLQMYAASSDDSRTTVSGDKTLWESTDAMSVFLSGTSAHHVEFTAADAASGLFEGTVTGATEGETYNWSVVYPYNASNSQPTAAQVCIGCAAGASQVQAGIDSKAHLSGANVPLYGAATAVAATTVPSLTMHHMAAFVCVKVTNGGSVPMNITRIALTTPYDLVGTWTADLSGATPELTAVSASKTANLTFEDGSVELAAGAVGEFFLAVKPFTLVADDKVRLTVTTDDNTYTKLTTATGSASFAAGIIKSVTYTVSPKATTPILPDGDYLIIAATDDSGTYHAMSSEANSKDRLVAVAVTDYNSTTDYTSNPYTTTNGAIVWTIKRNSGNTYTIENGGKYLTMVTADRGFAAMADSGLNLNITESNTDGRYNITTIGYSGGELTDVEKLYVAKNGDNDEFGFFNGSNRHLIIIPATVESAMPVGTVLWQDDFSTITYNSSAVKNFAGSIDGFTDTYTGSVYPLKQDTETDGGAIRVGAGSGTTLKLPKLTSIPDGVTVNVEVSLKAECGNGSSGKTITISETTVTPIDSTNKSNNTTMGTAPGTYTFKVSNVSNTTQISIVTTGRINIDDLKVVVAE